MSTERNVERAIRDWLEDGLDQLPDRYLDAALDDVSATDQRRHSRLAWRPLDMSSLTRTAIAAVAVLVLAVVVVVTLSNGNTPGGPGASPSLEPTPSPVPTSAATERHLTLSTFVAPFSITLPADWLGDGGPTHRVVLWTGSSTVGFWGVSVYAGVRLFTDPCHPSAGFTTTGEFASPADLATGLQAIPGVTASDPVSYSSPGHAGTQVDWQYTAAIVGCEPANDEVQVFATDMTHTDAGVNNDSHQRWFITEVNGRVVVIEAWAGPNLTERMIGIQPVVDSITFE